MKRSNRKKSKYASKAEKAFAIDCEKRRIKFDYEPVRIKWQPKVRVYIPDFLITKKSGEKFYVEYKGFFDQGARSKMAMIKKQYPNLDIRIVFMKPFRKIGKRPKSLTYAQWAEKHGYMWADKTIPKEWLK